MRLISELSFCWLPSALSLQTTLLSIQAYVTVQCCPFQILTSSTSGICKIEAGTSWSPFQVPSQGTDWLSVAQVPMPDLINHSQDWAMLPRHGSQEPAMEQHGWEGGQFLRWEWRCSADKKKCPLSIPEGLHIQIQKHLLTCGWLINFFLIYVYPHFLTSLQ